MARSEYEVAGGCYLFGEESIAMEHEGGCIPQQLLPTNKMRT